MLARQSVHSHPPKQRALAGISFKMHSNPPKHRALTGSSFSNLILLASLVMLENWHRQKDKQQVQSRWHWCVCLSPITAHDTHVWLAALWLMVLGDVGSVYLAVYLESLCLCDVGSQVSLHTSLPSDLCPQNSPTPSSPLTSISVCAHVRSHPLLL